LNRDTLLPAAYLLDQIAGDPEWFPHPVRLIGFAISRGEAALHRRGQSGEVEFTAGAVLTMAVVGSTYWLTAAIIRRAQLQSSLLGNATELLLGWTCLAARNLEQEATAVVDALGGGNMHLARRRLARIVGRDTQDLHSNEISRAVVETVAESASDGMIAPLFYMTVGGVPLAMAYKAINTLDSMIGHADSRYLYFGKAAARLDDAANYVPARITALAIVTASLLSSHADPQTAWQIWRRDGGKHKSPNAGQPESAMAGALHVSLGGDNTYAGEVIPAQRIGQEFPAAAPETSTRAIRLVSTASLLALTGGVILATLIQKKGRR
jgi:adenosylcobinamide-phosphate synthase